MKVWRLETKLQELKSLLRETGSSWESHIFAKSRLKARDKPGPPKKQCGLALCSEFCLQRSVRFSAVQCLAVQCTEWNIVHWVQRTQLSSCKNDSQGYRHCLLDKTEMATRQQCKVTIMIILINFLSTGSLLSQSKIQIKAFLIFYSYAHKLRQQYNL